MINVLCGPRGSGKTEEIIKSANNALDVCKGSIVFVTDTYSYSKEIKTDIRFINIKDYLDVNEQNLLGFISGVIASNNDISKIYIDGFARMLNEKAENLEELLVKIELLSSKLGVDFYITVTASSAPAFIKKYIK